MSQLKSIRTSLEVGFPEGTLPEAFAGLRGQQTRAIGNLPEFPYENAQFDVVLMDGGVVSAKTVRVTKASLGEGWQTVTVDWDLPEGRQVSYLHLQTLADGPDAKGAYFRSLKALPEEK